MPAGKLLDVLKFKSPAAGHSGACLFPSALQSVCRCCFLGRPLSEVSESSRRAFRCQIAHCVSTRVVCWCEGCLQAMGGLGQAWLGGCSGTSPVTWKGSALGDVSPVADVGAAAALSQTLLAHHGCAEHSGQLGRPSLSDHWCPI